MHIKNEQITSIGITIRDHNSLNFYFWTDCNCYDNRLSGFRHAREFILYYIKRK